MRKSIKVLYILLFSSSLLIPAGKAEEQYNHFLTIKPTEPDDNLWFGHTIDVIGDKIIITEPKSNVEDNINAGKISIYNLEGTLLTILQSPEPYSDYDFGRSMSFRDNILVTREAYHDGDIRWVGKVYVYTIDGNLQFSIEPDTPVLATGFGSEVHISEKSIFLQEPGVDMDVLLSGMVHEYSKDGEYLRTFYSPAPLVQHRFGSEIETFNDFVYISEYGGTSDPVKAAGRVYVFDNQRELVMMLESSDPQDGAVFGLSISISRDYIVVGEPWASFDGLVRAGRVHVFSHSGELINSLQSPLPSTGSQFGWEVEVFGENVVVGEINSDIVPHADEGRAYLFDVNGELLQTFSSPDPTHRGYFGWSIDVHDDILAISELWAEVDGMDDCGSIHLYKLSSTENSGSTSYLLIASGAVLLIILLFIYRSQRQ